MVTSHKPVENLPDELCTRGAGKTSFPRKEGVFRMGQAKRTASRILNTSLYIGKERVRVKAQGQRKVGGMKEENWTRQNP